MHGRKVAWLAALVLSAGCGVESAPGREPVGDPGPGPLPKPEPVPMEFAERWRSRVVGNVSVLATTDVDGDGRDELLVGGTRPQLLAADGTLIWQFDWQPVAEDPPGDSGDTLVMKSVAAVPAAAGSDVLALDGRDRLHRIGGVTGEVQWVKPIDVRFHAAAELEFFGDPAQPLFYPTFGYAAYDAATGEERWRTPFEVFATLVAEARRGDGEPTGLYLAHHRDKFGEGETEREEGNGADEVGLALVTPEGERLFYVKFPAERQLFGLAAATIDASGHDAAVIALDEGRLAVWGADGQERWNLQLSPFGTLEPARNHVAWIFGTDLTGDGIDEVVAVVRDDRYAPAPSMPYSVHALAADGTELWSTSFTHRIHDARLAEVGGRKVLLFGAGIDDPREPGEVLLLDLSPAVEDRAPEVVARVDERVQRVGTFPHADGERLLVASEDATLSAWDPGSEAPAWERFGGGWHVDAAAIDGDDGTVGVAVVDATVGLAFSDAEGRAGWRKRLDVGSFGFPVGVVGSRTKSGAPLVVAASLGLHEDGHAVEGFTVEGERHFVTRFEGEIHALAAGRFGPASFAIVEGMRGAGGTCRLLRFDGDGSLVGETGLAPCAGARLFAGDVDGDGRDELAAALVQAVPFDPPLLALVGGDGGLRWIVDEFDETTLWIELAQGAFIHGGATAGARGFVARRDPADGALAWLTTIEARPDEVVPSLPPLDSAAATAALVPDTNGDGAEEIATFTGANEIYLLDVATGAEVWRLETAPADQNDPFHPTGGTLLTVPPRDGLPAHLLAGEGGRGGRSSVLGISLEGEVFGAYTIDSEVMALLPVRDEQGGAVVAGIRSLYAIETQRKSEGAK